MGHGGSNLSRTEEKLVEMSNGCICCTLPEDLLMQVKELASQGKFDYLLIERTGISEPLPVATTFDFRDEDGQSLSDVSQLDTMVTVVDAPNLIRQYSSTDFLRDHGESLGEEDEGTLVDLLVEQIEFANVIILNKIDLISKGELDTVKAIIRGLNAKAKIIETTQSQVDLSEVMNTGSFNLEEAQEHPYGPKKCTILKTMCQRLRNMALPVVFIVHVPPLTLPKFTPSSTKHGLALCVPKVSSGSQVALILWERSHKQALLCVIKALGDGGPLFQRTVGQRDLILMRFSDSIGMKILVIAARRLSLLS